jgi:hypothetical protein
MPRLNLAVITQAQLLNTWPQEKRHLKDKKELSQDRHCGSLYKF